ncbi:hypothetical protein HanHA300_Chr01g0000951 [Helianthus annuus]|nr:hypothetical protein HanHA300_Chr01g0000951 [Helianthus annuus]KAJ0781807.1 hypothetical protein HanLR1_Chr01g0001001 [Helianthus annuus]
MCGSSEYRITLAGRSGGGCGTGVRERRPRLRDGCADDEDAIPDCRRDAGVEAARSGRRFGAAVEMADDGGSVVGWWIGGGGDRWLRWPVIGGMVAGRGG